MVKDIFKSLNSIHKDSNLTIEEKHLLTILIKYHNVIDGYSYPTYEVVLPLGEVKFLKWLKD